MMASFNSNFAKKNTTFQQQFENKQNYEKVVK